MARRRRGPAYGTVHPAGAGLGPKQAAPKENYGNNNAEAFAQYAKGIGLDPATWRPPGVVGSPPPDPAAIAAAAAAQRNVQYADANATYQQGALSRDYGYNAQGQIDPSNPYSKAALLQRNFKQSTLGNTNSYAANGNLYSGALQNAQNATTFGYLAGSNNLLNQYHDAQHNVTANQLATYANSGSAVSDAQYAALLKALGQG